MVSYKRGGGLMILLKRNLYLFSNSDQLPDRMLVQEN